MFKLRNRKGLTLVEIIISMAILGIVTVSFLTMYTSAITTVFFMGDNNKTVVDSQAVIDRLYQGLDRSMLNDSNELSDQIDLLIPEISGQYEVLTGNKDTDFYTYDSNAESIRFHLSEEELVSGETVNVLTMLVFYRNGSRFVETISPLPEL